MDVQFFAANPRKKARPEIDDLLSRGIDQLAVASAFCTGAGVEILRRHSSRLRNPGSFAVVSAAEPTDYKALEKLHELIPGNLFVHWGSALPREKKNGAALMHSKVLYARRRNECWLWTGSHNLTGNATQGANCEAAILLHGDATEQPFVDAIEHLQTCKAEASVYDPEIAPPIMLERADVLIVHAETTHMAVTALPWHIHLCLNTEEFDGLLRPPAEVRLYLYNAGSLGSGWQGVQPIRSLVGRLTGLNLTNLNSSATDYGIQAQWQSATHNITETRGVLSLGPNAPVDRSVTTQAVISILEESNVAEGFFSQPPRIEFHNEEGLSTTHEVDGDLRRFFFADSLQGQNLVYRPIVGREQVISVPTDEMGANDYERLRQLVSQRSELPLRFAEEKMDRSLLRKQHPFILRAKFRLPYDR